MGGAQISITAAKIYTNLALSFGKRKMPKVKLFTLKRRGGVIFF